jgi:hypothetical protein
LHISWPKGEVDEFDWRSLPLLPSSKRFSEINHVQKLKRNGVFMVFYFFYFFFIFLKKGKRKKRKEKRENAGNQPLASNGIAMSHLAPSGD